MIQLAAFLYAAPILLRVGSIAGAVVWLVIAYVLMGCGVPTGAAFIIGFAVVVGLLIAPLIWALRRAAADTDLMPLHTPEGAARDGWRMGKDEDKWLTALHAYHPQAVRKDPVEGRRAGTRRDGGLAAACAALDGAVGARDRKPGPKT